MSWLDAINPFRFACATRRRRTLLNETYSQLADALAFQEYYNAIVPMLLVRAKRLENELMVRPRNLQHRGDIERSAPLR